MSGVVDAGRAARLAALLDREGVGREGKSIVYFTAEWTAPVDAVVLPYIKQQTPSDQRLVVVKRGEYGVNGGDDVLGVSCDHIEFRDVCREVDVTRLPACVLVDNASFRVMSTVYDWPVAVGDAYPPLNSEAEALVQLREEATALFEQGDFVGGALGFTRALLHCPTCPKANFNMSVILQMMDELYFAVDHMLRVVRENDNDAVAHTVLRTVLHPAEPVLVVRGYESVVADKEDHHRAVHSLATIRGEATTAAPAYVRQVFDHLAETFEEKLVTHLEYRVPWQIVDTLQRAKALPSSGEVQTFTVVDLGCGTGLCGRLLRPFASYIAGIDLSPLMIEKSRESGFYDEAETADIIPYLVSKSDASLDLIVSADVWIYVGELDEIFPLVAQKLRPRGWFAFSTELLTTGDGFQLASSGRFKHSDSYINSLATLHGFTVSAQEEVAVRKESGEPIRGRVFVLQLSS